MGQRYYNEFKKILKLIINEDADFDLLKEVFYQLQKKSEYANMEVGVLVLLLINSPKTQKEEIKAKVIQCLSSFHFENDFVMERYIKMIEQV